MTRYFIWLALLPSLYTSQSAKAQVNSMTEKRFYVSSITAALGTLAENEKAVYSGPLYTQYFVKMGNGGHPFFHNLQPESIMYDDILYSSVNFIYDVFLDEIVVINPDSSWIRLNKNRISYFLLGGHKLQKMKGVTGLQPGFYEMMFEDQGVALIAKWTKVFNASVWKEKVSFFVLKGEKTFPVNSKNEMLKALSDREEQIKDFVRSNDLSFRKNNAGDSYKRMVEFYSSLGK